MFRRKVPVHISLPPLPLVTKLRIEVVIEANLITTICNSVHKLICPKIVSESGFDFIERISGSIKNNHMLYHTHFSTRKYKNTGARPRLARDSCCRPEFVIDTRSVKTKRLNGGQLPRSQPLLP